MNKTNLVGPNLCQSKIDYEFQGVFFGSFLSPKIKYCITKNKFGTIQEHKTFEGFDDSERTLDGSQNFKLIEGKKNQPC